MDSRKCDLDESTHSWYEANANEYRERTSSLELFPGLQDDLNRFLGLLPKGSIIADLGAGAGRDAKFMSESGHPVIALDTSPSLLRICMGAVGPNHEVHPVRADLEHLPFATGSLDGIWACGSLLHLSRQSIPQVIAAFYEVLRSRGAVGISMKEGDKTLRRDGGRLETCVSRSDLMSWLHTAGFVDIEIMGPSRHVWLLAVAKK